MPIETAKVDSNLDLETVKATALKLLAYCQAHDWAGYDPYDALNSRLFEKLPFLNSRWPRLILTQLNKRSPINLRPLLLIPPSHNPKGLALFITALIKLRRIGWHDQPSLIDQLLDKLLALRSEHSPSWCWGYNFPWQQRYILVPRGYPNIISTTFSANAVLDCYEETGELRLLDIASSSAEYILNHLYCRESHTVAYFNYTPIAKSQVHNASLLGAALLSRVSALTGNQPMREAALDATRYSVSRQQPDGSWLYGEHPSQAWIDNFHTGYNLLALKAISHHLETTEFDSSLIHGLSFYLSHFFCDNGAPRYFHQQTYPIDIHSVALSLITLSTFHPLRSDCLPFANSVLRWALDNLWDNRGFFHYQIAQHYRNQIPYMRWGQAWMLLALTNILSNDLHRI